MTSKKAPTFPYKYYTYTQGDCRLWKNLLYQLTFLYTHQNGAHLKFQGGQVLQTTLKVLMNCIYGIFEGKGNLIFRVLIQERFDI